jgi:hypothetical protein
MGIVSTCQPTEEIKERRRVKIGSMMFRSAWLPAAVYLAINATDSVAQGPRRPITGSFARLQVVTGISIDPTRLDVAKAVAVSAAPTGEIVVADEGSANVIVLSRSGDRLRTLGRKGNGPGEFQRVHALGWLKDTLVVTDRSSRNGGINLFDVHTGRPLETLRERVGYLHDLFNAGEELYVAVESHTGAPTSDRLGGTHRAASEWKYLRVTVAGLSDVNPGIRDSTQLRDGFECRARDGTIEIFERTIPDDHGPLRALIAGPGLVTAPERDSMVLEVRDMTNRPVSWIGNLASPAMTPRMWDSMTAPYRAVEAKYPGGLDCEPPLARPKKNQLVRAIATDEKGRIWVELTQKAGEMIYILSSQGRAIGYFPFPAGDPSVPWFVRQGTMYQITVDADGLQGLRTLIVRLPKQG